LRPVFSPPAPDEDVAEEDVPPEVDDELDPEELHAASRTDATTRGTARPAVCLSCMC
jgi:hypothetical protein